MCQNDKWADNLHDALSDVFSNLSDEHLQHLHNLARKLGHKQAGKDLIEALFYADGAD